MSYRRRPSCRVRNKMNIIISTKHRPVGLSAVRKSDRYCTYTAGGRAHKSVRPGGVGRRSLRRNRRRLAETRGLYVTRGRDEADHGRTGSAAPVLYTLRPAVARLLETR
uniref:Uncharacterized protein n=1 Tax=Schizaphis graminum TaxID=13262 RepID=A0A2S2NVQ5_SCHGA